METTETMLSLSKQFADKLSEAASLLNAMDQHPLRDGGREGVFGEMVTHGVPNQEAWETAGRIDDMLRRGVRASLYRTQGGARDLTAALRHVIDIASPSKR